MNRQHAGRSRALKIIAAILLFAGLFVQITMLSAISEKGKEASRLEREIVMLSADVENLELGINQYHNLDKIASRARNLGMVQPDETQIRVVHVERTHMRDTSTQAAGDAGGEKVN